MTDHEKRVYDTAIEFYGRQHQMTVALEELSELQKEICKMLRGMGNTKHLAEEMADVEVILDQLKIMFSNELAIKEWKQMKVNRLEGNLQIFPTA